MWNDDDEIAVFLKSKYINKKSKYINRKIRDQRMKEALIKTGYYWDETLQFLYDNLYCESLEFCYWNIYVDKNIRKERKIIFFNDYSRFSFETQQNNEFRYSYTAYEVAEINMNSCPIARIELGCDSENVDVLEDHSVLIYSAFDWYLLDSIRTFFDMLMEKPVEIKRISY